MAELCFALKPNAQYYESNNECYALVWHQARKMRKEGKCGTMRCPFYKPNRSDLRLGDKIVKQKGGRNGMAK